MVDGLFLALLVPKNCTKKLDETSTKPKSKKSALDIPEHQTK
jgi:hypothetical protein